VTPQTQLRGPSRSLHAVSKIPKPLSPFLRIALAVNQTDRPIYRYGFVGVVIVDEPVPPASGGEVVVGGASGFVGVGIVVPGG
jgi:hypothetical protein